MRRFYLITRDLHLEEILGGHRPFLSLGVDTRPSLQEH